MLSTPTAPPDPNDEAPGPRWPALPGPWIVGFSYGPDSTLLLARTTEHCRRHDLPPPIAVHVDHAWHPDSAAVATSAATVAKSIGARFRLHRLADVRGESAARRARHEVFSRESARSTATCVLLGHHRDDQRETILHRLLRGTGPLGLTGIAWQQRLRSPAPLLLVRPLLDWSRERILTELDERALPYHRDPSNADLDLTIRNRIRHRLLPRWRDREPDLRTLDALAREAAALRRAVDEELTCVRGTILDPLRLEVALLRPLSPWSRERLFAEAISRLGHEAPPRRHLKRIHGLLDGPGSRCVESRGRWIARREGGTLRFAPHPLSPAFRQPSG